MDLNIRLKVWHGQAILGSIGLIWLIGDLLNMDFLKRFYRKLITHKLVRTELFDKIYYLDIYGDVAQAGADPLTHYVRYGDFEGRSPMPLFDPVYYRKQINGRTKDVNALLHYAMVGRYLNKSPCRWFNTEYYKFNNPDVDSPEIDPLLHFLKFGGFDGRNPCPQFDCSYYTNQYPAIVEQKINPLLHYITHGINEGYSPVPTYDNIINLDERLNNYNTINAVEDFSFGPQLAKRGNIRDAKINVIVPVYRGRMETLRCISSVLGAKCDTSFELIVINDASQDKILSEILEKYASEALFTLLINKRNRGFIYSVNRGMAYHSDRDVILLNSDTEVYDGWVDRMVYAAYKMENIGTVTPLSNNATICSYPHTLYDNQFPLELCNSELDKLVAEVNQDIYVETPTAVGFCMYIKNKCLRETGYFDEKAFGRGYGEENDFCQKAIRNGWKNIIAANVYVYHSGSASFLTEKTLRIRNALNVLDKRYPDYRADIDMFIQNDPLAQARNNIDMGRLRKARRKNNILLISHNRGGGTERLIHEYISPMIKKGMSIYFLRPKAGNPECGIFSHHAIKSLPNLPPIELDDINNLIALIRELEISEIHLHSLVDFNADAAIHLTNVISKAQIPFYINLHDYAVICPRINLVDQDGCYCGEPDINGCNQCLHDRGSIFNVSDIVIWRDVQSRLLDQAEKILVPDKDVAQRLGRYFSNYYYNVVPHEADLEIHPIEKITLTEDKKLRIVIIGAIDKIKGYDVLLACARDVKNRNLPLEFVLMGYSMNNQTLKANGVIYAGKYQDATALETLRKLDPHIIWLPSIWPETYCYTLSIALKAGFPVAAFDIGAIASRLRKNGRAELLMPMELVKKTKKINKIFLQYRKQITESGQGIIQENML